MEEVEAALGVLRGWTGPGSVEDKVQARLKDHLLRDRPDKIAADMREISKAIGVVQAHKPSFLAVVRARLIAGRLEREESLSERGIERYHLARQTIELAEVNELLVRGKHPAHEAVRFVYPQRLEHLRSTPESTIRILSGERPR